MSGPAGGTHPIELRGVGKSYGDRAALTSIDLQIESGKTTALIGPSGCGKSTLIRLMIGLIQPTTGTVLVDGAELSPANKIAVRRKVGYVIQEGGLFPHLTATDNVLLMRRHLGMPESENKKRLSELVDIARIEPEFLKKYPLELSGGQRQRISLMRALALDPEILLLDEPLGALDPIVRNRLQQDLKEMFAKLGKTVVLVTHDMSEAGYLADTIVLLRDGKIVQSGTLMAFQTSPSEPFVQEFLGAQRSLVQL